MFKKFGEFPTKYRPVIWARLLQLPANTANWTELHSKGFHPSITTMQLCDPIIQQALDSVMSALVYWTPLLKDIHYLQ
jgi:hypothetical protein